jgi:hypothetical protein
VKSILNGLCTELEQIHEKSSIRQYCLKNGYEWNYSLITTALEPGGLLILGFNWGVSKGEKYQPQSSVDKSDFFKGDVGSLSRIIPYCENYFDSNFLSKTSQSNYCFFRSQSQSQISNFDIKLCEPIFEKLICAIKPSSILCFSSKLRDFFLKNNKIYSKSSKIIEFEKGLSIVEYEAIRATLESGIEIKFLPHPNYPMKGDARSEAWEFCCGK